ncbi:MAG: flagellar hook capping FlgD N-terminal domain-containing protein [Gemmata sp.]
MATSALSGVSNDQFLQLLVAQLQNQDPLDPVSDKDFLNQLATLNTVQGLGDLNASFSQMLKLQQLTQGADLIGKTIQYTPTGGGDSKTGKVDSVVVQNGNYVLKVGNDSVGLGQIQTVTA